MGDITYAVSGVPLDDNGGRWRLLKATTVGLGASVRAVSTTVPGVPGTLSSGREVRDEAALVLKMSVRGDTFTEMMKNYSGLSMLLAPSDEVTVTRTIDGQDMSQPARGRTIDKPEFSARRKSHIFTATMRLPSVFWRGPLQTWQVDGATSGTEYSVTPLKGSTGPILDALLMVTGPAVQPRVECDDQWAQLDLTLSAGVKALIDCANWTVRTGAGVTFSGGGSLKSGSLVTSGGPHVLLMQPTMLGTDPTTTDVKVALSATGMTSASGIAVRARSSHVG